MPITPQHVAASSIDLVRLNFNPQAQLGLSLVLALVMFGIALDLTRDDFRQAWARPRALVIGLLSHHVLYPAATFLMIVLLRPAPSIGLGMLLVASCPAGHISNFFTHRANGNTALSVSISTLSTLGAIVMTPLNVSFWASRDPQMAALLHSFSLDPARMLLEVGLLLGLPLALGLLVQARAPTLAKRLHVPMKRFSMLVFLVFVLGALALNWAIFLEWGRYVVLLVLAHNALALAGGYTFARLAGLAERDCRAVAFETGIQNSGLGLVLIFNFFDGLGGMAIVTSWWGIWHIAAGTGLSTFWLMRDRRRLA
ncbi:bile acid:sodium symporter family protein [Ralstonia sp. UBA689]|uniref:bile acid:sodium symporter family protein n=1 Tax=Ralstonia sp. UBA689 TaxID=1947373 RepID=UPI0025E50F5C|nr:bile acid:sodium symporter family protein [Ralstonia sp. UBA689]